MFKIVIWGAIPITYFLFQFDFIYHLNSLDLVVGLNIFTSINLLNFYPTIIQCSHMSVHLSCGPSTVTHTPRCLPSIPPVGWQTQQRPFSQCHLPSLQLPCTRHFSLFILRVLPCLLLPIQQPPLNTPQQPRVLRTQLPHSWVRQLHAHPYAMNTSQQLRVLRTQLPRFWVPQLHAHPFAILTPILCFLFSVLKLLTFPTRLISSKS